MYVICDSSYKELIPDIGGLDTDELKIAIVELELIDLDAGDCHPDPKRGIGIAFGYIKSGIPVILIGERKYEELESWNSLFMNDNVLFCRKPATKECYIDAIKKLMPGINI